MRIERVIVESDCVDFPVAGRLREMAERNREAVYLEVAAGSEELCALTRSNRMIGEMKSTVVVSRREGFYIDQAGAGTGNPACDYDIEFVWGCLHRCAFCQQMYFLPRRPYIEICPDVPGILREVKHIVQNSERRLLVFEAP